jgi:hypothetical protein
MRGDSKFFWRHDFFMSKFFTKQKYAPQAKNIEFLYVFLMKTIEILLKIDGKISKFYQFLYIFLNFGVMIFDP